MKSIQFKTIILLFSIPLLLIPKSALSVVVNPNPPENKTSVNETAFPISTLSLEEVKNLSRKKIEKKLNRRLKFSERLALRIIKRSVKRAERQKKKNKDPRGISKLLFILVYLLINF